MVKNPKNWQPEFLYEFLCYNSSLGNKGIDMIFFLLERSELEDYSGSQIFLLFLFSHCNIENYNFSVKIGPIVAS